MRSKILVLSDFVIDQIAAGEVLENPASAVKELVENALDAGASEIRLEIEGGGLQRILIEDDGCGMSAQDAPLSLKRHATSKIRSATELDQQKTMGFRGEALAALASVSQLELRTSDGTEATQVIASGGEIRSTLPCARNRGTSIEARNLFFNAPARLKFQKSSAACAAAVLKVVETLALSHPEVNFSLYSNGKRTFEAKAKEWQSRIEEVRGPFPHSLQFAERDLSLRGVVSRPEEGKMNRSGQTLFINRRPIVSPLIARGVKEGFGTRMTEALFPSFVLFLELPPDLIDVNVHPQKKEVRFRDEGRIFSFVRKAVSSLFEAEMPEIAPLPWVFTQGPSYDTPLCFSDAADWSQHTLPLPIPSRPLALLGPYLLLEEERWILVDLPGAEARILFESMESKKPETEPLLWPLEMEIDSPEEVAELLRPVGIEARPLGKRGLAIDALPSGLNEFCALDFVQQYSVDRKLAANVSRICRARTKKYSLDEGKLIWEKLKMCKDKIYDPLGRKIISPISEEELAKQFV